MRQWLALAVVGLLAVPVAAQEAREGSNAPLPPVQKLSKAELRADLLDRLFARLHNASSDQEGQIAESAIWKIWMSDDSATAEALIQQATRAMNGRQFDASLKILNTLVEDQPDFAEAWNKRATVYFMMGKYAESLADIDKVLDLEPRHFGALAGLGMIKRAQGDLTAALKAYQRALAINPQMPGVKRAVEEIEDTQTPI